MGLLAAVVGYAASFSIVLAGLSGVGASDGQAATGLFFATLAMGLCSIWIPMATRTPAAIAWSTPGAAFLASSAVLPGGFSEAVGGLIMCAGLIVLTGLLPPLRRLVVMIPKALASALLAGVLFRLCIAPALALGSIPALMGPIVIAWGVGLCWHRLAAMPLAVIAFIGVLVIGNDGSAATGTAGLAFLPVLEPVLPHVTAGAFISIALPLYLVTMAGQNIPGFAMLELHGYPVERGQLLRRTGTASLLIAPFGSVPVNMSAITAAMMSSEDAGADPAKRYWAAIINGFALIALAFLAGVVVWLGTIAPPDLFTGLAGLALIPAFVAASKGAFDDVATGIEAPALTFLIVASGMSLAGISGAVWGLVAGGLLTIFRRLARKAS